MILTKEEDLFNRAFKQPIVYFFVPNKNEKKYVLTEMVSQNPLRVKSLDMSNDLLNLTKKGKDYAHLNGCVFIENEY